MYKRKAAGKPCGVVLPFSVADAIKESRSERWAQAAAVIVLPAVFVAAQAAQAFPVGPVAPESRAAPVPRPAGPDCW